MDVVLMRICRSVMRSRVLYDHSCEVGMVQQVLNNICVYKTQPYSRRARCCGKKEDEIAWGRVTGLCTA